MAALGAPIINDAFYPVALPCKQDDMTQPLQLLARAIAFVDPLTGAPRRFDHMLVSAELVPEEAEYRRDWSEGRGLSDHAPLLVSFRVRSEWSYEAVAPTGPTF